MAALPFFTTTVHAVAVTSITGSSSGVGHTCALTINGNVQCWGYNGTGQLGDGTTTQRLKPVNVKGLSRGSISAVAAGGTHSCALTKSGGVKCWGGNSNSQLGVGTQTTMITTPVDVIGLNSGVIAITAGEDHTCALTIVGAVKCWGSNSFGQLGDGTTTRRATSVNVIGLNSGVAAIAVGTRHSCAITSGGAVKCWGDNGNGQLGDGTTGDGIWKLRLTPVDVIGLGVVVSAVAVGGGHSCALTGGGAVKCWGLNSFGVLGDGTTTTRLTPVDVVGLSSGVIAVLAGYQHTCALLGSGGIKCWGSNGEGQLGDGTTTQRLTPVNVVGLGSSITNITAGSLYTCAITSVATEKCWGENRYGQLGDDTTGDAQNLRLTPVDVLFDRVKNDYNNHGLAGWIWKGEGNGYETQSQIWRLSFPLYSNNWAIPARSYPPQFGDQTNWDIVTTGDFDNDSDADILWRNKTTAQWRVWQMQDGTRVGQNDLAGFDLPHGWQVSGAGDADKDGDDDIILNNTTTGDVMIWKMQNNTVAATHAVGTKAGYVVKRIGDFNMDGDVDLMLSQVSGLDLVVWEIEANNFVQERTFKSNVSGWDLACAGDFDYDGDADILLVNSGTKQEKWFEMQNYTRIAQHVGATNTGFTLLGCGDIDGDGNVDMLWQRSSDDMNRAVLQQNWGGNKQTVYTNPFGGVNPGNAGYGFKYRNNGN